MAFFLHELVSDAASRWPGNIAIIEAGRADSSVTYRQFEQNVRALSSQLFEKGLKKGERVGILSRNSITFAALYFAISRCGGVVVPLNHTLDVSSIIKQADDCALAAVYAEERLKNEVRQIIDRVKSIRFIVEDNERAEKDVKIKKSLKINEGDLASIIYTSGTVGRPLGVMLNHKNLISNNRSIVKYTNITPSDKICCVLPFCYIYGLSLLFSHFLAGGTVIIENRFMYPNVVLDGIDKHKATGLAGVPSHYAILLYKSNFKKRKLPSLRYFMQAGDRMSPNITKDLVSTFPDKKLFIMYGQTEASPRLTYLRPGLTGEKPGSVGRAIPGVKIRVVNKSGRDCRPGEKGEIIARGDNVMLGYWNNKKETKKVIKDGWLYTGDIAFRDKEGDLFIVGRMKNFIKVGAHRINPFEIEEVVMGDKKVAEAAAVGAPDALLGRRIKLFVSLVPGARIGRNEIITHCKNRLPSYKVPSEVIVLASIPKNNYGKIDREALKVLK